MKQGVYIFMPLVVSGIGGGQLYIRNKQRLLRERGWEVLIFPGKFYGLQISGLCNDNVHSFNELQFSPFVFTKKRRERVLAELEERVSSGIGPVVIESSTVEQSLWGELLAERTNAIHTTFLLGENQGKLSISLLKYLDFKHSNRQLVGIHGNILPTIFNDYKELSRKESYSFKACCSHGVVENCTHSEIDSLVRADINIGCIGRIDKPYVQYVSDAVLEFAANHLDKEILFVILGGYPFNNSLTKEIKDKALSSCNCVIKVIDWTYPIPLNLMTKMDFFVSGTGSAVLTALERKVTLVVDVNDCGPVGVLGVNTNSAFRKVPGIEVRLVDAVEDVYQNLMVYEEALKDAEIDFYSPEKEFDKQMQFLGSLDLKPNYYSFSRFKLEGAEYIEAFLIHIMGLTLYNKVFQVCKRVKRVVLRGQSRPC
ncbi:MAG: hypothetical protein AB7F23_07810 [Phycisphaerae bacterium]